MSQLVCGRTIADGGLRLCSMTCSLCFLVFAVLALVSCKKDVPEGILDEKTMENVLYDYHMAQKLGESPLASKVTGHTDLDYNKGYYIDAALNKYGLTQTDFDRSMEWYLRHSEILYDIYKRLQDRVASDIGATPDRGGIAALSGDTANIWQGPTACLLSSTGTNRMTFDQRTDTLLQSGDRIALRFNADWFYREGARNATAMLCVLYANDSIAVSTLSFSTTGLQEVSLMVGKLPVVGVRGFIYQQAEWSSRPKLLSLSAISLVRFRSGNVPETGKGSVLNDSVSPADALQTRGVILTRQQHLRDSLQREDSVRRAAPHFK